LPLPMDILKRRIRNEIELCRDRLEGHRVEVVGDQDQFPVTLKVSLRDVPGPDMVNGDLVHRIDHVFVMEISEDYPYQKPLVIWATPIFHPNSMVPEDGGFVCTKLLENWSYDSNLLLFIKGIVPTAVPGQQSSSIDSPTGPREERRLPRGRCQGSSATGRKFGTMGKGRPRIVKETRKRRLAVEPPPFEEHAWAPAPQKVRVFLSRDGADDLVAHCEAQAETRVEAMGFLAGGVFSWKGRSYTVIRDAVTTSLDASAISVRFDRDGFPELFSNLDQLGYDYLLVGWYHSHPGYGCFMSETDLQTQGSSFSEAYHVALVVDPVRKEMKAFGSRKGGVVEIGVGIYDDRDWFWPGSKAR